MARKKSAATAKAQRKPKTTRKPAGLGERAVTDAEVEAALLVMESGKTMTWAANTANLSPASLYRRMIEDQFKERYDRARRVASYSYVQQAEDALDPDSDGLLLMPHQVTLRVARSKQKLWLAGRLNPAEFSDHRTITHEGNPEKPVEHKIAMTAAEAYQKLLDG